MCITALLYVKRANATLKKAIRVSFIIVEGPKGPQAQEVVVESGP